MANLKFNRKMPDYTIRASGVAPPDYPVEFKPDTYSTCSEDTTFEARRAAYIRHCLNNPAPENTKAIFHELIRMKAGAAPHLGVFEASLDFIDARRDCADFVLHGVLRLLYQLNDLPGLPERMLERARASVLSFKYWPDEPGSDSLCTWTENHHILFSSAAYLAGQMFPRHIFTNSGQIGEEKMAVNRSRILRWLELRYRSGFSEWLSNVYYDEDLAALLSMVDFCQDEQIARKSEAVINLLLLDMALNSYKGVFGSSHGRSYEKSKKWSVNEGTADTSKLLFGTGIYSGADNMSAACFALSRFRLRNVIEAIAREVNLSFVNLQRMGIRLAEAERWGLDFKDLEDGMTYLTLEAYTHPRSIALTMNLFEAFNWWENGFFSAFKPYRGLLNFLKKVGLLHLAAKIFQRDLCRNTREEVNLYSYRTPDYLLSTAQDYRKGYGGDQQQIWQATLGPGAVCFTTHPARLGDASPNYWTGSGLLPRAAQIENVAIIVYRIEKIPALYVPTRFFLTHAWFPKDQFDRVIERDGWVFACKENGYLGLRSQQAYRWQEAPSLASAEDAGRELIAEGAHNIWICEMGRYADNGEFDEFINEICRAELKFGDLKVVYQSPSQGRLEFGWAGELRKNGQIVSLRDYPRYNNPFVKADFPLRGLSISHNGIRLRLDWEGQVPVILEEP